MKENRSRILECTINGIKSIDQDANLSFFNKAVNDKSKFDDYNVKAIYGMNGAGKSGLIYALEVLKKVIIITDYLNNPLEQKQLESLINKKNNSLKISVTFASSLKELRVYTYKVELVKGNDNKFIIGYESLVENSKDYIKNDKQIIFEIKNGILLSLNEKLDLDYKNGIAEKTLNLLQKSSLASLLLRNDKEFFDASNKIQYNWILSILALLFFGVDINVYYEQSDDHTSYCFRDVINKESDYQSNSLGYYERIKRDTEMYAVRGDNTISKENFRNFERTVNQLSSFIKVFKDDLQNIEIDKREKGDDYQCRLIMVYKDYRIDYEFESTGIKKLINLFSIFKSMVNGAIAFVDELDANIHDVYLCALIDYLSTYGEGQLIFTTHNVSTMEVISKKSKSIDFLSMDHKIYPWIKNGRYQPLKLYKNGMIEGSPFNIRPYSFLGLFEDEEVDE